MGEGVSTPLHAMYILGAQNSKRKLFYIANPSACYFYVKTIISVDFQICISVCTVNIFYCIWNFFWKYKRDIKESEGDVLYNCHQFLHESHLNFDKFLTHFYCYLLWKMFAIYCCVWNFFEYIKEVLKSDSHLPKKCFYLLQW